MRVVLSLMLTGLCAAPALANEPELISKHNAWTAYSRADGGDKICYVLSEAKTKSPSSVRHGDIYFMVANWRSGVASEQPSFLAAYTLKQSSPPTTKVGSARYEMYTSQNEAFIDDRNQERDLVQAMRDGSTLRVDAMSSRGTSVNYTFSLSGVTAALKAAKDACS